MYYKNGHCKDVKNGKNRHPAGKQKILIFLDERGVSDVVGNILMVAITVIMAAIIAGAIFGMEPPADVPHVSYKIEINGMNLNLSHMGGEQVKVSDLKFMVDGVETFNTTDSEINNTEIWKIGKTITLNTSNSDLMIVHLPSKELL
jgi:flagellin-like protein